MPRPPRLHIPGGCYHVMLRGNHREPLFGSIADRQVLTDILVDVITRFDTRIHAFCWMSNHLHALLQIAHCPLGSVMQRIAMRYARHRHKTLNTSGHLFERRYRARWVDADPYFLTLLHYIHLNPVQAGMVTDPAQYPWSSHRAYLGTQRLPWLTTDFGLSLFSTDPDEARSLYARFISEPNGDKDVIAAREPSIGDQHPLGTGKHAHEILVDRCKPRSRLTLEDLGERICQEHHISIERMRSPSRARDLTPIRVGFITQAVELRVATLSEVARFLQRDPSALTKLLARHKPPPVTP
jgi:putative transposase